VPTEPTKKTLLIVSQVYVPDPASVGQHIADAAAEMVRRGYRVRVLTSARGYEDPSVRYLARETIAGVEVRRLPLSSWGKKSILHRLAGQGLFLLQAIVHGLWTRRLAGVLVSTSPPMASVAALAIGLLRRAPITFWVMDLNPDQAVALGAVREDSLAARVFRALNRRILARARGVVVLDRFMAQRVCRLRDVTPKLAVLPPWPHEVVIQPIAHADNPFRAEHGLAGKFVLMYSGNMSVASPIDTFLEAALRLQDQSDLLFLFIGGGAGKQQVQKLIDRHHPANVRLLPYQKLDQIKYSLSAADVHLVALGTNMVGIIHPCKVYGAMAVARPVLFLGPRPSHVSDLLEQEQIGWQIDPGDVDGAVAQVRRIRATDPAVLRAMGETARQAVQTRLSKPILCGAFCDVLEKRLD
jgi:glycosyltransferase involved in cell wall biosynthesis